MNGSRTSHASARRTKAWLFALTIAFAPAACSSEPLRPTAPEGQVAAAIVGPGPLSAAVVEVTGAVGVDLLGGAALTHPVPGGLRAVLLLDGAGTIDFFVTPADPDVAPSALVLEVADAAGDVPGSPEAYRVDFR